MIATPSLRRPVVGPLAMCLTLTACGGGASSPPVPAPPPAIATTLTLGGAPGPVLGGATAVPLSATLDGAGVVSWTLAPGNAGSLSASSGNHINYVPPARVNAATQVTITAASGGLTRSVTLDLLPDPAQPGLTLTAGTIGGHFVLDGQGGDARFDLIVDMAVDRDGNTYVADSRPGAVSAVRLLGKDGAVSTLTADVNGHADGDRGRARVENVRALAACGNGKLYLLDLGKQASYLRTLDKDGGVATVATLPAAYAGARRIFCDDDGKVYVAADTALGQLAADGSVQDVAGLTIDQRIGYAKNYLVDHHGNIYYHYRGIDGALMHSNLYKRTPAGDVSVVLALSTDSSPDGPLAAAAAVEPDSLTVDGDDNLLMIDYNNYAGGSSYRVRKISGGAIATLYAGNSKGNYLLPNNDLPGVLRVAADGGLLLSYQSIVNRISGGQLAPMAGLNDDTVGRSIDGQGGAARYFAPGYLAADGAGNVYSLEAADYLLPPFYILNRTIIRKTTPSGAVTTLAMFNNPMPARPGGLALAGDGTLYIALLGSRSAPAAAGAIYRLVNGAPQLLAGTIDNSDAGPATSVDGAGAAARFARPTLNGVDADGNLYVTDRDNAGAPAAYRKVTPQGVVSTIAALPRSVTAAPDGYVYRADAAQGVIWRIAADGGRSVAAGVAGLPAQGTVLGPLPARLDHPLSIVPTGPHSFAVAAGGALLRLVLP